MAVVVKSKRYNCIRVLAKYLKLNHHIALKFTQSTFCHESFFPKISLCVHTSYSTNDFFYLVLYEAECYVSDH
jgi:hypothetical protein